MMKGIFFVGTALALVMTVIPGQAEDSGSSDELILADFSSEATPNNVGGDFGTWNYDPDDETQGCYYSFEVDDHKDPLTGTCIRLDYDVQSKNPAFNGFWMKLRGIDASPYDILSFWAKGATDGKFTSRFKVELKNSLGERAVYQVQNLTKDWQEFRFPFKNTKAVKNWTKMDEFTIVFDDILATYKEGSVFVDHITLKK